eukprot:CAMPEP_0170549492 /NCGR_PEP_ID=MMETSP0211-20121228/7642_1 /TAXON_ID=311385 /ORGANISM="Pseudokeronopsis sp., Strain OXSARD2" /LENGTH=54 /DNA_ID=CAMNT_0010855535 /DNA_START=100 /DNA_END=264 /DNA_ORIENTATION=-
MLRDDLIKEEDEEYTSDSDSEGMINAGRKGSSKKVKDTDEKLDTRKSYTDSGGF